MQWHPTYRREAGRVASAARMSGESERVKAAAGAGRVCRVTGDAHETTSGRYAKTRHAVSGRQHALALGNEIWSSALVWKTYARLIRLTVAVLFWASLWLQAARSLTTRALRSTG